MPTWEYQAIALQRFGGESPEVVTAPELTETMSKWGGFGYVFVGVAPAGRQTYVLMGRERPDE